MRFVHSINANALQLLFVIIAIDFTFPYFSLPEIHYFSAVGVFRHMITKENRRYKCIAIFHFN